MSSDFLNPFLPLLLLLLLDAVQSCTGSMSDLVLLSVAFSFFRIPSSSLPRLISSIPYFLSCLVLSCLALSPSITLPPLHSLIIIPLPYISSHHLILALYSSHPCPPLALVLHGSRSSAQHPPEQVTAATLESRF